MSLTNSDDANSLKREVEPHEEDSRVCSVTKKARTGEGDCSALSSCEPPEQDRVTVQLLKEKLRYAEADLLHEREKWAFFKKRGKRLGVWNILVSPDESLVLTSTSSSLALSASSSSPLACASSESCSLASPTSAIAPIGSGSSSASASATAVLDTNNAVIEGLKQEVAEVTARKACNDKEVVRLTSLVEELQKKVLQAELKLELVVDDILEHSVYKALYNSYLTEKNTSSKIQQQLTLLQDEITNVESTYAKKQKRFEEIELKRRTDFEAVLFEKDVALQAKEDEIRNLGFKEKQLDLCQQQLTEEREKLKEYTFLVSSLRTELSGITKFQQAKVGNDFAQEIERITKAYEEMADQNARALRAMEERDRLNAQTSVEKNKLQQANSLLKLEREKLLSAYTQAKKELDRRQTDVIEKLQAAADTLRVTEVKLTEENRALNVALTGLESEATAAKARLEEELARSTAQRKGVEMLTAKVDSLAKQLSTETAERRKCVEELSALQKKWEFNKDKVKRGEDSSAEVTDLLYQIKALKSVLNCNICSTRRKSVVLTRCYHLFCSECVEENVRDRSRKCPICSQKFSEADVHPIYL